MSELVPFDFRGDLIEVAKREGAVWVSVRRVCEALGLDPDSQRVKLKGKAWACTVMIAAHDVSGRIQKTFCLHLDSLPMWLATIDARKVGPAVRAKLGVYQKECARVLRDHFLGAPSVGVSPAALDEIRAEFMAQLADLKKAIEAPRIVQTEATTYPTIGRDKGRTINNRINAICDARLLVAGGLRDGDWRSLRKKLDNEVRELIGYGPGAWLKLPWSKWEDADRVLGVKEKEFRGGRPMRRAVAGIQATLFDRSRAVA